MISLEVTLVNTFEWDDRIFITAYLSLKVVLLLLLFHLLFAIIRYPRVRRLFILILILDLILVISHSTYVECTFEEVFRSLVGHNNKTILYSANGFSRETNYKGLHKLNETKRLIVIPCSLIFTCVLTHYFK